MPGFRKGFAPTAGDEEINLADYFEWDDQISCLSDLNEGEKITGETCDGCDHITACPDAVKPKKARGRS